MSDDKCSDAKSCSETMLGDPNLVGSDVDELSDLETSEDLPKLDSKFGSFGDATIPLTPESGLLSRLVRSENTDHTSSTLLKSIPKRGTGIRNSREDSMDLDKENTQPDQGRISATKEVPTTTISTPTISKKGKEELEAEEEEETSIVSRSLHSKSELVPVPAHSSRFVSMRDRNNTIVPDSSKSSSTTIQSIMKASSSSSSSSISSSSSPSSSSSSLSVTFDDNVIVIEPASSNSAAMDTSVIPMPLKKEGSSSPKRPPTPHGKIYRGGGSFFGDHNRAASAGNIFADVDTTDAEMRGGGRRKRRDRSYSLPVLFNRRSWPMGDELDSDDTAMPGEIPMFSPHVSSTSPRQPTINRSKSSEDAISSPSYQDRSSLVTPSKLHYMPVGQDEDTPMDPKVIRYAVTPGMLEARKSSGSSIMSSSSGTTSSSSTGLIKGCFVADSDSDDSVGAEIESNDLMMDDESDSALSRKKRQLMSTKEELDNVLKSMDSVMATAHVIDETLSRATMKCPVSLQRSNNKSRDEVQINSDAGDDKDEPMETQATESNELDLTPVVSPISVDKAGFLGHLLPEFELSKISVSQERILKALEDCQKHIVDGGGGSSKDETTSLYFGQYSSSVPSACTLRILTPPETSAEPETAVAGVAAGVGVSGTSLAAISDAMDNHNSNNISAGLMMEVVMEEE